MTNPITPPPELVEKWIAQAVDRPASTKYMNHFATQAAQWGADQELEACCEWLWRDLDAYELVASRAVYLDHNLRASRRPKPSSLKEQALAALEVIPKLVGFESERDTIRAALEALDD